MTGPAVKFKRSPFCLLHWRGADLLARNAYRGRVFRIGERYLPVLHNLTDWVTVDALASAVSLDEDRLERALERLVAMDLVLTDPPPPGDELPAEPDETPWDVIDLAFQRRTSFGGYDPGAPRPGHPPPATKPPPESEAIALVRPDLGEGPGLWSVMNRRRSVRTYGEEPLAADDLGRFLFACARLERREEAVALGEVSFRPSPSAGARHPLELYLLCNDVAGLDRGAYFYDPAAHALHLVRPADEDQERITHQARTSTGDAVNRDPAVVILVTAVFQRTTWKYDNIGLSLILKDVGALYQTMYLVATALRLAPCGLGAWMDKQNAEWLGLDPLVESQVGSFLLGYPAGRLP